MPRMLLLLLLLLTASGSVSQVLPDQSMMMARAPASFQALFRTTKGDFTIEVYREWSPLGADRLYQLLATGFFNNNALFRVQPGYVIQFGIGNDPVINKYWDKHPIPDEPVVARNTRGTLSYARDGVNSRTVQLFINRKDNPKLDTVNYNGLRGFPPVARIISGFEVTDSFYAGYGFEPANFQDSIMVFGNGWLKNKYPELEYIIEARITGEE